MKSKKVGKNKRKLAYEKGSTNNEYLKIVKIFIGVLLVLGLTYFLALLLTGELKLGGKVKEEVTETIIQYDEIIAGEVFNRPYSEYYVILFNFTDNYAASYLTYRNKYLEKEKHLPFFLVDLEKGFNISIVANSTDEISANSESITDFKVREPSIIKISNKKIVERIEEKETIFEYFKKIIE